jgi:hypothetical protein
MIAGVSEWSYNDRPAGTRFVPDRVAEPARSDIEREMWDWPCPSPGWRALTVYRRDADADGTRTRELELPMLAG